MVFYNKTYKNRIFNKSKFNTKKKYRGGSNQVTARRNITLRNRNFIENFCRHF